MENRERTKKVAAACIDCGRVFAATLSPDESIRIIGRPNGCHCGGTELRLPIEQEETRPATTS